MSRPESFAQRLRRHADADRARAAIVTPVLTVGYGELVDRVDACARALRRQGVGPGDVAALTVRDEALHLVATLALMVLGVPQMTAGSHEPLPMRARLAARVGVTRVVASADDDRLDGLGFARVRWDEDVAAARDTPRSQAGDGAIVYLTGSGTTGDPKIVAMSERQLALQADRGYSDYAQERVLRLASVEHNNSKRLRLYCLWQGGACLLRGADGADLAALCDRLAVTWLDVAPYHLEDMVRAARRLPAHTRVRCGGSRVPLELRRAVLEHVTPHLHVSYGTTETGGVCLAYPHEHDDPREPVGRPVAGVELEIVDADRRPVAPGEVGEVRLRASGMVDAYVADEATTRKRFVDGWFYPGDLAYRLDGGAVCLQGRLDDMMILNGMNIYPAEVERVLESMPGVRHAACLPVRSPVHGEIPVAAVEVARDGPTAEAISRYAREQLGMRAPRRVVVLDAMPRNPGGKIVKREIAALIDPAAAREPSGGS